VNNHCFCETSAHHDKERHPPEQNEEPRSVGEVEFREESNTPLWAEPRNSANFHSWMSHRNSKPAAFIVIVRLDPNSAPSSHSIHRHSHPSSLTSIPLTTILPARPLPYPRPWTTTTPTSTTTTHTTPLRPAPPAAHVACRPHGGHHKRTRRRCNRSSGRKLRGGWQREQDRAGIVGIVDASFTTNTSTRVRWISTAHIRTITLIIMPYPCLRSLPYRRKPHRHCLTRPRRLDLHIGRARPPQKALRGRPSPIA
jgi:hypothetical protein